MTAKNMRLMILGYCFVLSLIILLGHLGLDFTGCDTYCMRLRHWVGSKYIAALSFTTIFVMAWCVQNDLVIIFRWLAITSMVVGIAMFPLQMLINGYCGWCIALSIALIAVAISSVDFWKLWRIAPFFIMLSLFQASLPFISFGTVPLFSYELRQYESSASKYESSYVLFVDINSEECRRLLLSMDEQEQLYVRGYVTPDSALMGGPLRYRWFFDPNNREAMQAALAVETVKRAQGCTAGIQYQNKLLLEGYPLADLLLVGIAKEFGCEEQVAANLINPPKEIVSLINADIQLAQSTGVQDVPAVFSSPTVIDGNSGQNRLYRISLHEVFDKHVYKKELVVQGG